MLIIIFTGPPASGKSSIANRVGEILGINVISKDECKIRLFETYGFTNHAEKKKLSIQGEKNMYKELLNYVNTDKDIIVDNNFKNFDELRKIIRESTNDVQTICFSCMADYPILAERYNARIQSGSRHQALYTLNVYPVINGISKLHPIITSKDVERIEANVKEKSFGNCVQYINTNNVKKDFTQIVTDVIHYIELCR